MKRFINIPGTKGSFAHSGRTWRSSPLRIQSSCRVIGAIVLTLLIVATACEFIAPSPVHQISYEGLCGLPVEQFLGMDEQKVRQWLTSQYGSVSLAPDLGVGVTRLWSPEKNGISSTAFLRQGSLIELVQSLKRGPTFGQVVSSLGRPDSIFTSWLPYEKIVYSVGMDYPTVGISVQMNSSATARDLSHNGKLEVQMKEEFPVDLVQCYAPRSSMEEVIRNGFPSDPKSIETILKRRKAWSGFGAWVALEP
jgi:hypothetical protein